MSATSCQSKTSNAIALRGLKSRRRFALVSLGMTTRAAGVGQYLGSILAWVKLDDSHQDHPKLAPLSDRAYRLWVRAIAHSNRYRLNGVLTASQLRQIRVPIRARMKHETELIRSGLWRETDGGIAIHDVEDYQPSAAKSADISQKRSDAGKKGAAARWGSDGKLLSAENAPVPTRPDPSRPTIDSENKSGLMLGEINDRLEQAFGVRGFISSKWQPKIRALLPYSPDEVESAIKEAQAADPELAGGGLVASILIRYRRKPAQAVAKPSRTLRYVEPLGPDGLPRSAIREGSK